MQTLIPLLDQCKSISQLKQIHAQITSLGLSTSSFLISKLLHFSATSSSADISYAFTIFRSHPPNSFFYNTIIRGFSNSKTPNICISLYSQMLRSSIPPDHLTFPFLLKACARLVSVHLGSSIHGHVSKLGLHLDRFIQNSLIHLYFTCKDTLYAHKVFDEIPSLNSVSWNSMIDGYAKCGDLRSAQLLFDEMPDRDVISWSSLIDGYVKAGEYKEAISLFDKMKLLDFGPKPNDVTMISVLCACAHSGTLDKGREVHHYIKRNKLKLTLPLATSLIDMYAKCGLIEDAVHMFRSFPLKKSDVLIWNAMICGLAMHGMTQESISTYREMESYGIAPDEITYLGLLTACAHGGLVEEAWRFFKAIRRPHVEHYACMVDVLSRAGKVLEAFELVSRMPGEAGGSVLGAVMSGCRSHGWRDVGEVVGRRLVELEPEHDGRYVGLANVYAEGRRWREAKGTREEMERKGVKKVPGYSEVEVEGRVCRFVARGGEDERMVEILEVVEGLGVLMRDDGLRFEDVIGFG